MELCPKIVDRDGETFLLSTIYKGRVSMVTYYVAFVQGFPTKHYLRWPTFIKFFHKKGLACLDKLESVQIG